MRRMGSQRQPSPQLQWDVNVVLEVLARVSHDCSSLFEVTNKACFLLCCARLSEWQAWCAPPFFSTEGVTISFDALFISKKKPDKLGHIPRLTAGAETLCPLAASKAYLSARQHPLTENSLLWFHPKKGARFQSAFGKSGGGNLGVA
jgi:hypothetical protein